MDTVEIIKKTINSANINFLIGSGFSYPFLDMLTDIEDRLTAAEKAGDEVAAVAAKKEYFEKSIFGNIKLIDEETDTSKDKVLSDYCEFYRRLNYILLQRENSILTKQVNIFTTNIDVFSEKALEDTGIEFNDGFHGRFTQKYDIGNFKKSYHKTSLHYENTSEIPVFNVLKLHGSVSWDVQEDATYLDSKLNSVRAIKDNTDEDFEENYNKLSIVNPTNKKFEDTTINQRYYDLLRIYSNELEKENSVLFVGGFSFADSHIHDLTLRVADSNPTLKIFIFNHGEAPSDIFLGLERNARNKNITVLIPEDDAEYNLETITSEIFSKINSYENITDVPTDSVGETTEDVE